MTGANSAKRVTRQTVDLSAYPDLVVIYLGMRVNALTFPPHAGMRQYWRDYDSLERWTRSEPHRDWWRSFLRDSGGTGFWHETYFLRGGMEAIFDDMAAPTGMMRFAPLQPARGTMFSARRRAHLGRTEASPAPLEEQELYANGPVSNG